MDLIITAPVKGWAAPLAAVPDPVFAERMMGDGVAIEPIGSTLHAPCDGAVINLHSAGHAVTIRNAAGAEILMHIGLETVALGGKGFRTLVAHGDAVSRGDPLIDFDMDAVALGAVSLITPIVIVNSSLFRIEKRTTGKLVGVGEALMTLVPVEAQTYFAGMSGQLLFTTVTVPLVHGIHARPAARIGECARQFEAEVNLLVGERRVSVRSPVALMGLGVKFGDEINVEAQGPDAEAALDAVVALIESGMGEAAPAVFAPRPVAPAGDVPSGAIGGIAAAPGLAIGPTAWLTAEAIDVPTEGADAAVENAALDAALDRVRARIAKTASAGSDAQRHILEAHLAFLSDPDLIDIARVEIAAGRSAGRGWRDAICAQVAVLRASGDARFAERAADLEDLEHQVQLALAGREHEGAGFAPGTILLADDLLPSQLIGLDANIAAVALGGGGPTSHVAILAAARGLPMLVAAGEALSGVAAGTTVVLDADAGLLHVAPSPDALEGHCQRVAQQTERRTAALAAAHEACRTADGTRIELFANLGSLDDAKLAAAQGAEGSGLLRTEFLFMDRPAAPSEDEQHATYQAISDAMGAKPVIVRLLDIGGDKPAPWLAMAAEKNPMLGVRGIRVSLAHPELLEAQLRAILRVTGDCRVMVPMVAGLGELRAVRAAAAALDLPQVQIGVMIETPAAAVTADLIAAEADFLSIGTNDLTQYTLAMDRENSAVAAGVDALHPAVLRLIAHSAESGARHGKTVGVCGGLASDALGIPLLIGLGVTELSTTPSFVPEAKALVRRLDLERCRSLATQALDLGSAVEIRTLARNFIEELN